MQRRHSLVGLFCLAFCLIFPAVSTLAEDVALRITLGIRDREPAPWAGEFVLQQGSVVGLESLQGSVQSKAPAGWQGKSFQQPPRKSGQREIPKKRWPMRPLMFLAVLDVPPEAAIGVKTAQGEFSVDLAKFPVGSATKFLEGRAQVERLFPAHQVTKTKTQDDYPSACTAPDGTIWIAYSSYTDGIPPEEWPDRFKEEPKDLSFLAKKPGGDQIYVVSVKGAEASEPMAITDGGEDLYGTAIGGDGKGRIWAVWSANLKGNWALLARCCEGGNWGKTTRLTNDAGPDINPVMAATKTGRLWLVWQGFRGNNSDILGMYLDGDKWSKEIAIGKSPANEWDPAVTFNSADAMCVVWDTYQKGDYDVYYATVSPDGQVSEARPAAASLQFEAKPSVAYDNQDRLWIAWEQEGEKWGKDFGATDPEDGIPLYKTGRTVAVKCFVNGIPHHTSPPFEEAIDKQLLEMNNNARLAKDGAGRIWFLFRHRENARGRMGTVWSDYATWFDGKSWSSPVLLCNSDGLMQKKPAITRCLDGSLCAVYNSDARQRKGSEVNDDIWMSRLSAPGQVASAALQAEEPVQVAQPIASGEAGDVARIRAYRATVGGKQYRPLRGEWHRHTETSGDGGGDGTLLDMFRYGIDVASMDWLGNGDHDNGGGREYFWWITQKLTDVFHVGDTFVPMFTYERSVRYPDGHRNPMFATRGIRTLPRLSGDQPNGVGPGDTKMLYRYLRQFNGLCASHTSATDMGTDWRDNDPEVEPVIEIFQGCRQSYEYEGAPRSGSEEYALGGWRPAGFYWKALEKGYILGIESSSDHISTHISYTVAYAAEPTRQAIFDALKKRHSYGATDNIVMDVRMGDQMMMGDVFRSNTPACLDVKIIGTDDIARVDIIKNNDIVYTKEPNQREVALTWEDKSAQPGRSYYYVRALQKNNEIAWASPMWIDYEK